jgi:hypothetical protein
LSLAAVTVHFLSNILARVPTLKNLGLIDVGLSAGGAAGSLVDLGGRIGLL